MCSNCLASRVSYALPHSLMCQYENENVFKHVIRKLENLNYNYVDDFHFI